MSLIAKETGSGGGFDPVPEGTHTAVCYAVVDLGTHHSDLFKKDAHKVLIMWEIPEERIEVERDGKTVDMPRAISKRYTMSLHKKASLRHDLEAWRGKRFTDDELQGFDLKHIVGVPCLLGIVHATKGEKTYADISSIMAMPRKKGEAAPKPENPTVAFEIPEDQNGAFEIPDDLPEWVQGVIMESKEYNGLMPKPIQMPEATEERAPAEDEDDQLPF